MDEIPESFQNQFGGMVLSSIHSQFPDVMDGEKLDELVLTYANQIFSTAESVQDKVKTYNEVRLSEEVSVMNKVVTKLSEYNEENRKLVQQLHQKARELMVRFNPGLMDFSCMDFVCLRNTR